MRDALNFYKATVLFQKLYYRFGSASQHLLANQARRSAVANDIGYLRSEFAFPVHMTDHGIGAREQVEGNERVVVLSSMSRCAVYETCSRLGGDVSSRDNFDG